MNIYKLISCLAAAFLPIQAFAAESAPQEGTQRIGWAIKCCKAMPKPMIIGFILLAAMIAVTVVLARSKEEKANEK